MISVSIRKVQGGFVVDTYKDINGGISTDSTLIFVTFAELQTFLTTTFAE
jgi:hypothetical protein